ncbi:MAG: hypothetical protein IKI62_05670 [Clostridia bacterium]|nr:hypothetical protein [Clostridia bacterium]
MNSNISLRLPSDSKYILPLRLFIAGVAIRMDFPAETVEDIKMANAEAGSILINGAKEGSELFVEVFQEGRNMIVELSVDSFNDNVAVDDISSAILSAMSDECELIYRNGTCSKIRIKFEN